MKLRSEWGSAPGHTPTPSPPEIGRCQSPLTPALSARSAATWAFSCSSPDSSPDPLEHSAPVATVCQAQPPKITIWVPAVLVQNTEYRIHKPPEQSNPPGQMCNHTIISPVDIRPKKTRQKTETEHQNRLQGSPAPNSPTNGLQRFSLMPPASHTTLAYNTWPGRQGQTRCLRGLASQPLQVYCPSERFLVQDIHDDGTVIRGSAARHGKSVQFVLESHAYSQTHKIAARDACAHCKKTKEREREGEKRQPPSPDDPS